MKTFWKFQSRYFNVMRYMHFQSTGHILWHGMYTPAIKQKLGGNFLDLFLFTCMYAYVCLCTLHICRHSQARREHRIPGSHSYRQLWAPCWELNLSPLQSSKCSLTTESSPQPRESVFALCFVLKLSLFLYFVHPRSKCVGNRWKLLTVLGA